MRYIDTRREVFERSQSQKKCLLSLSLSSHPFFAFFLSPNLRFCNCNKPNAQTRTKEEKKKSPLKEKPRKLQRQTTFLEIFFAFEIIEKDVACTIFEAFQEIHKIKYGRL